MSHELKMVLGCLVPLLLIFVLPLLGFGEGFSLFVFVILMFGCHLFMMRGHHKKAGHSREQGGHHEHHQR